MAALSSKRFLKNTKLINSFTSFVLVDVRHLKSLIQFSGAKAILHSHGKRFDMGKTVWFE
jgi:hypothetical protein